MAASFPGDRIANAKLPEGLESTANWEVVDGPDTAFRTAPDLHRLESTCAFALEY